MNLFGVDGMSSDELLAERHYLGPSTRGEVYRDDYGVMVFANPSSRMLPQDRWLELVRWCIVSETANAGSRQWRGRAALAVEDVSERDDDCELFRSERWAFWRALSCLQLAVGADVASITRTAERQRYMGW